ncbi:MAG: aldolase/citrate lyase family protein, partial [Opitutales bacterium]|nr:aldolase/citrate lyase family protein [Opitutales bacterium]
AEEAREVVRWSKFHPKGERGFDGGSADNNYGSYPANDYTISANEETWIVAQIESPKALENVEDIATVEGIDCVFFGPGDYSALSGRPGDIRGEPTLEAARQTAEATLAAGKVFGTLVFEKDHAEFMKDLGARMLVVGADIIYYKEAYSSLLDSYSDFR